MPLVYIMHSLGGSSEFAGPLSEGVHTALVSAFGIPVDDRFHVISTHIPGVTLVGPASFLGVKHSNRMVLVQIACAPGRSVEQKKSLYTQIARNLAVTGYVTQQDVVINLVETARENWSFGDGLAQFAVGS